MDHQRGNQGRAGSCVFEGAQGKCYIDQTIRMLASWIERWFGPTVRDQEEFVRLTYRSEIRAVLPTTTYSSDAGWGCMLRVVQMALANLLTKREGAQPQTVVPLFWDNSDMPFSIQVLTQLSSQLFPDKKACEWYSPSEAGFLIQGVLQKFNLSYRVMVSVDGSLFLEEIPKDRENLVILLMARIGLDKPEPQYLDALAALMKSRFCFCVLGGTPRHAHLFLKESQGYLGYLDPHETRKAAQTEEELLQHMREYAGKLEWVKREKISSSMCIMLVLKNTDVEELWKELHLLKHQCKDGFFIYLDHSRPHFDHSALIEITDF